MQVAGRNKSLLADYRLVRFGRFELNPPARLLSHKGHRVRLQEQPLRILEVLLAKPGELVTREELRQQVWGSDINVNFEAGLNAAIKKLRLALSDSADNPRFIETVPKCGYRFIAPVQFVAVTEEDESNRSEGVQPDADAGSESHVPRLQVPGKTLTISRHKRRLALLAAAAMAGLVSTYWLRPAVPFPKVADIRQITKSSLVSPLENLFTDGPRLYYHEFRPEGEQLGQVVLNGNEDTVVEAMPRDFLLKGLSPDGTTFLALAPWVGYSLAPIDVMPVAGSVPRHVGDLSGYDATWSPDGGSLVLARDGKLFLARLDGGAPRLLASPPGWAGIPRWSPDGMRLRFTLTDATGFRSLWEVSAEGRNLRRLSFNLPGDAPVCCGD